MRRILFALLLIGFVQPAHGALITEFSDPANPNFVTAVQKMDLRSNGFGIYNVNFVSGLRDTLDGWSAITSAFSSSFSNDIFPNVADSSTLSQLIKRELVQLFNQKSIQFVSGLSVSTGLYEAHTRDSGVNQLIALPYASAPGGTGIEGTFLTKSLTTSAWGTNDLTGNIFSSSLNAGSSGWYWAIVSDYIKVPEPSSLMMFGVGLIMLMIVVRRRRAEG